jgi:hypothetical protein
VLALEADLDTCILCLQQFSDVAKDLSAPSNNPTKGHRMTFVDYVEAKMKMKMKTKIRPSPSAGSQMQQTLIGAGEEDSAGQDNTTGWLVSP